MNTAFITGGSGFVGRALIQELVARGVVTRALARSPQAEAAVRAAGGEPVAGDLADEAAMQAGMRGADVVIHAAAKVEDWGPRAAFQAVTIDGTRAALRAARAAGVPKFVHIGTEAVLAGGGPIVRADETRPYPDVPNGLYPWSKGQAERDVIAANAPGYSTVSRAAAVHLGARGYDVVAADYAGHAKWGVGVVWRRPSFELHVPRAQCCGGHAAGGRAWAWAERFISSPMGRRWSFAISLPSWRQRWQRVRGRRRAKCRCGW